MQQMRHQESNKERNTKKLAKKFFNYNNKNNSKFRKSYFLREEKDISFMWNFQEQCQALQLNDSMNGVKMSRNKKQLIEMTECVLLK